MRIDRYLHCIRLVKSRSQAQALVERGHVRIDGKRVLKTAEAVREGQVIALPLRHAIRILRVTAFAERRGSPVTAETLYIDLAGNAGQAGFEPNEDPAS